MSGAFAGLGPKSRSRLQLLLKCVLEVLDHFLTRILAGIMLLRELR